MAATYEPIATATPNGVSEFTFSSISGSYTDLVLVGSIICASSSGNLYLRFNGVTSGTYCRIYLSRSNATNYNGDATSINIGDASSASLNSFVLNINNYSATTLKNKHAFGYHGWEGGAYNIGGSLDTTSAITSITIGSSSPNIVSPSRLTLYGITRA